MTTKERPGGILGWVRELIGCFAWSRGRQCGARAVGRLRLCRYHRARRRNGDEPTVAEHELFDLGMPWRVTDQKRRLAKPLHDAPIRANHAHAMSMRLQRLALSAHRQRLLDAANRILPSP